MAGTVTIDLGELPHGEPVLVEEAWPVRQRLRRLRPRHLRWAAMAAGLVVLVLATTGAAAARPRPALVPVAALTAASFGVDQATLYVLDDPEGPLRTRLTAYALGTGAVRWQVPLPEVETAWLDMDGALLLVSSDMFEGTPRDRTTALDPDSGRRLWTREGWPSERSEGLLLLRRQLPADIATYELPPRWEITAVTLATGDPVWTREIGGWGSYVSGDPAGVVTLTPAGRLELYDFHTGRPVRSAPVTAPDGAEVLVAGSVGFVFDPERNAEFAAYDLQTMTRLWTLEAGAQSWPGACGRLLCVSGFGPVRAIEPATGETAWNIDWLPEDQLGSWSNVYDPDDPALAGYLLVDRSSGAGFLQRSWLVDAETGEPVLDLHRWQLAPYPALSPTPARPMATWYADYETGVTWIGRLRPDLSGVDPIGSIQLPVRPDAPFPQCLFPDGFVVCGSHPVSDAEPGELRVWRIR